MKNVYIFLADGFEDMEALCTLDILRRGEVNVCTVSNTSTQTVVSAHQLQVSADLTFDDFVSDLSETLSAEDMLVFPGGMPGSRNLADNAVLMDLMKKHHAGGGAVAAICAAPALVASQLPGFKGLKFTCYDGMEELPSSKGGIYTPENVVTDGKLITGRGPGFAMEFALTLLRYVRGEAAAAEVKAALLL